MESDSDHFESADEDFETDKPQPHNSSKSTDTKQNAQDTYSNVDVQNLSLHEPKADAEILGNKFTKCDINVSNDSHSDNANKHSEINASVEKPRVRVCERKEKSQRSRESKTKLGTKLGTKVNKEVVNWEKFDDVAQPNTEVQDKPSDKEEDHLQSETSFSWNEVENWPDVHNDQFESDQSPKLYSKKSDASSSRNMWDNESDYMELPREKQNEGVQPVSQSSDKTPKESGGWSSWGSWGVSSILSSATTLTNTVSHGLTTVLESGIGAPDPEKLARYHKEQDEKQPEIASTTDNSQIGFGLGNLVSGVTQITKLVETTGTKVLTGGLDTLEVIGKKTMAVLQEGDPGLKKKRAFLKINHDKPVLSHILREAKEKAEEEDKVLEQKHIAKKAHFETIFDDYQGLVHLEALEMLSKQCDIKLETLMDSYSGAALTEVQETMAQIKELCELPEEENDNEINDIEAIRTRIDNAITEINIAITYNKFLQTWSDIESWLDQQNELDENSIHQKAIESLAQLTAIAVEQFHKAGELLLVKERRSTVDESDSLVQLTTTLTGVIGLIARKFSEKLTNSSGKLGNENDLITNIFLEAANSSSYIQDAFNLIIPVLQVGAI